MLKKHLRSIAFGALVLGIAAPAFAQKIQSGSSDGLSWTAQSRIIGNAPTATFDPANPTRNDGGGDSRYFATDAKYSPVVTLIMEYATGSFICSGTMISQHHVMTAAHCVSDGAGTANPLRTRAFFNDHSNPNEREFQSANSVAIAVSKYYVNSGYTGEVIDQNDVAILALSTGAADNVGFYQIATAGDLTGSQFNVAGFGGRSTIGGAFGVDSRTGFLRQGDNTYSYRWGDAAFDGFFTDRDASGENFFGTAEVDFSYVSDFDNGLAANDAGCLIADAVGAPAGFGCETGVGAREVGVAGGDSGGPQFVNGKLASVTSYGLSFGTTFGDCRIGLNSSCGEFSGYVPLFIHGDFIADSLAAPIPEPQSWAMMLVGFGLLGAGMRARTRKIAFA